MNEVKENKNKLILFVFIGVLLAGAFYWYEVRPSSTKNECSKIAEEKVSSTKFYSFGEDAEKARDYNAFYQECLQKGGYKNES